MTEQSRAEQSRAEQSRSEKNPYLRIGVFFNSPMVAKDTSHLILYAAVVTLDYHSDSTSTSTGTAIAAVSSRHVSTSTSTSSCRCSCSCNSTTCCTTRVAGAFRVSAVTFRKPTTTCGRCGLTTSTTSGSVTGTAAATRLR